nr:myomodulin [Urechis unicinctus]
MRSLALFAIQFLYVVSSSGEENAHNKREMPMLRMGKRSLREIDVLPPLVPPSYDLAGEDFDERQVWKIPRVGKDLDLPELRLARFPPIPRLGTAYDDILEAYRRDLVDNLDEETMGEMFPLGRHKRSIDDDSEVKNEVKRAAPLPRLGLRDNELDEDERAAPLPRLGMYYRAAPLPRLGFRDLDEEERAAPLPRLGLRDEEEDGYSFDDRAAPLPRLGFRAAPLPRLGFRDVDKKAVNMLRMGRSGVNDGETSEVKRAMSMLRMGKRPMSMLRMGKRPMSMLRMGKRSFEDEVVAKRPMSMLRMGKRSEEEEKRAMSMLRMGKRPMSMLRMGRSEMAYPEDATEEEKRAMGMLRMGRSMGEEQKRAMGMLRMGKRPVSMLRMGKRDVGESQADQNNPEASS